MAAFQSQMEKHRQAWGWKSGLHNNALHYNDIPILFHLSTIQMSAFPVVIHLDPVFIVTYNEVMVYNIHVSIFHLVRA